MGKGDKKSKKGKISMGSYGVRRKRKASKKTTAASEKKAPAKKAKKA
jgi:30S ribosomal protein S31